MFASLGVSYLININTKYPFGCDNNSISPSLYYNITRSIAIFIKLLVFIVLAKQYKLRVRENIVQIIDEHYERYMDQEEEYEIQMELSTD